MTHAIYDNRHWVIISAADVSNIDFGQVYETSVDTLRYSIDESQTFVKYDGSQPSSVTACSSKSQEYDYDDILAILHTEAWEGTE